jgi:hypothetical protein
MVEKTFKSAGGTMPGWAPSNKGHILPSSVSDKRRKLAERISAFAHSRSGSSLSYSHSILASLFIACFVLPEDDKYLRRMTKMGARSFFLKDLYGIKLTSNQQALARHIQDLFKEGATHVPWITEPTSPDLDLRRYIPGILDYFDICKSDRKGAGAIAAQRKNKAGTSASAASVDVPYTHDLMSEELTAEDMDDDELKAYVLDSTEVEGKMNTATYEDSK